jgi:glycine/D-amino acid oxidase-like deaminating enzyme
MLLALAGTGACATAGSAGSSANRVSIVFRKVIVLARIVRHDLGRHPMSDKRDLLILGGGLVGMTLALAAARKGISSHVVDRADPAELTAEGFDGRASAISTASWNLLRNIGLAARSSRTPARSLDRGDRRHEARAGSTSSPSRTKARSAACSPTASCASRCSRRPRTAADRLAPRAESFARDAASSASRPRWRTDHSSKPR